MPIPDAPASTMNDGAISALYQPGRPAWMPKMKPSVECATTSSGRMVSASQNVVRPCRACSSGVSR